MRAVFVTFFLAAGAAQANDCKAPSWENKALKGLDAYVDCVNGKLARLETDNAKLQARVDKLDRILAELPGELTDVNGRVTRSGGGTLMRASYSLDARARQAAMSADVDPKTLEQICEDSCNLTLALTSIGLREGDPTPIFAVGPCAFQYKAKSGTWTRGGACGPEASGVDGDGSLADAPGGAIIVTAGEACVLADSGPRRSVDPEDQPLARDRDKGLVLIANPDLWSGREQRFRCDLRITR
jgi:hypothetical protein